MDRLLICHSRIRRLGTQVSFVASYSWTKRTSIW